MTDNKKLLLWGSYYGMFMNGILTLMLGATLPFVIEEYQLGYEVGGLLLAGHSVGHLVASMLVSLMAILIGRKLSAVLLTLTGMAGFLGMLYFEAPLILIALYFLTGLARGSTSTVTNEIVNEASHGDANAMNILHVFYALGAFIAPFLALLCVRAGLGWRTAILITAVALLARGLLFLTMPIREQGESTEKLAADAGPTNEALPQNQPTPQPKNTSYLRNPSYYIIAGLLFFYLGAESAINGWAVTYLKDAGIMSTGFAQSILSLLWVVIIFGRLFAGRVSLYIPKHRLLLFQTIGSFLFFILFMLTRSPGYLVVWIIGLGFFFAGVFPTAVAVIGPEIKGAKMGMGFLIFIAGFGAILTPMVTGMIAERVGIVGGMATISITMVLMLAFSIIVYLRTRKAN